MTKQQYFEYLGIYKFWDAGYTGKNVRIMSDELIEKDYYNTEKWHNIICPKGYKSSASHGSSVMGIMLDICPDATYYAYPFTAKNGCSRYIKDNNIHLFTCSNILASVDKVKDQQMQDCINNGCTFFIAAGNTSEKGVKGEAKSDKWLSIGIADFVNGRIQRVNPSAIGSELDYVMLPPYGRWTSWCSPTFTAMCGLVQDFFIEKTGKALNREQLVKFIDDNLMDIEESGIDAKSGKGLLILPEPSKIDIAKYVGNLKGDDTKVKICIDAGHGANTAGKRSPDGMLLEYEFNRDVARRLKDILVRHGVEVVLTCGDDYDIPLQQRCDIANQLKVDYFISIHANAFGTDWNDAKGWEIYVVAKGGRAEELAEAIHEYSIAELGLKDRGVKTANFYVLRNTNMPAVLIEHGFYTNKAECELLKDSDFRQKCAVADAKGILDFLDINYEEDETDMKKLILQIGSKAYDIDGIVKVGDVAPKIENSRTLVPIYLLRELGLEVTWNDKTREVTIINP